MGFLTKNIDSNVSENIMEDITMSAMNGTDDHRAGLYVGVATDPQ